MIFFPGVLHMKPTETFKKFKNKPCSKIYIQTTEIAIAYFGLWCYCTHVNYLLLKETATYLVEKGKPLKLNVGYMNWSQFKTLTYHPHEEAYHLYLMLVATPLFHASFFLFFLFLREFVWNSELLPLFLVFRGHYSAPSEINEFKKKLPSILVQWKVSIGFNFPDKSD